MSEKITQPPSDEQTDPFQPVEEVLFNTVLADETTRRKSTRQKIVAVLEKYMPNLTAKTGLKPKASETTIEKL